MLTENTATQNRGKMLEDMVFMTIAMLPSPPVTVAEVCITTTCSFCKGARQATAWLYIAYANSTLKHELNFLTEFFILK